MSNVNLQSIFNERKYIAEVAELLGLKNIRISDYDANEVAELTLVADRTNENSSSMVCHLLAAVLMKKLQCQVHVLIAKEAHKTKKRYKDILEYCAELSDKKQLSELFETNNFSKIEFASIDFEYNSQGLIDRSAALVAERIGKSVDIKKKPYIEGLFQYKSSFNDNSSRIDMDLIKIMQEVHTFSFEEREKIKIKFVKVIEESKGNKHENNIS